MRRVATLGVLLGVLVGLLPGLPAAAAPPPSWTIAPACTFDGGFEDGFADVPTSNAHESAIDCIVYWQITIGLRTGVYNPGGNVTREQMASFVGRFVLKSGGTLPTSPPDAFPDDETSIHEGAINKVAAVGIVTGDADGTYAPRAVVTRAQMATSIVRALEYRIEAALTDGADPDFFTDDDGDIHESNINKAAASGITGGIGGTSYGPLEPVRRDQMASFIARSLAEVVDPRPVITGGVGVVVEGDEGTVELTIPLTLSSPSGAPVSVNWATIPTAGLVAGEDYDTASGTVTFAPGETQQMVSVTVLGDTIDEPGLLYGAEWLFIGLSSPTNAVFGTGPYGTGLFRAVAHGFILDDD